MMMKRVFFTSTCALILFIFGCQPAQTGPPSESTQFANSISGLVLDEANNPIANAVVRVKATDRSTKTDASGRFTLSNFQSEELALLTAWAEGYYIGGEDKAGAAKVEIILKNMRSTTTRLPMDERVARGLLGIETAMLKSSNLPRFQNGKRMHMLFPRRTSAS
jgi:hypothetical protein